MRHIVRPLLTSAVFILALGPKPVEGQDPAWRLAVLGGLVEADGRFSTTRLNGKTVTSDIDGGAYLSAVVERVLHPRWTVSIGFERSAAQTYRVDQAFPDGGSFTSSDTFDYHAITAGVVVTLLVRRPIILRAEPSLGWGWVSDFTLNSAGPPYDRTTPLAIDGGGRVGIGLAISGVLGLGESGWGLIGRAGMTRQKVVGDFPADPAFPGSEGSIATNLNPAHVALGLTYQR